MAIKNLIISSATTGGVPSSVHFEEEPVVAVCPVTQFAGYKGGPPGRAGYNQWLQEFKDGSGRVAPAIFDRHGGRGHELGRVCAMGFSNGCILVDELLKFADAPQLDVVIAVDGIQGAYSGPGKLSPATYASFIDYGRYVVKHKADDDTAPVLAITHSVIVPPNSPSTTETAGFIYGEVARQAPSNALTRACGFDCEPAVVVASIENRKTPVTINSPTAKRAFTWNGLNDGWFDKRALNRFFVFGWGDIDPAAGKMKTRDPFGTADHIFQGKAVLPALLDVLVAERWNKFCGPAVAGVFSGFGFGASCKVPGGFRYGHAPSPALFSRSAPSAAAASVAGRPPATDGAASFFSLASGSPVGGVIAACGGVALGYAAGSLLLRRLS